MDTVVIGAGLAGLAAAQRLTEAGYSVTIVEARHRLGGRVWTMADSDIGSPIELGPEWIGASGAVHDLLVRQGARLHEAQGHRWRRIDGRWENLRDLPDITGQLLERVRNSRLPDSSLDDALNQCCGAPSLSYVEGFHAAIPSRLSVQWLTQVEETQPAEASELRSLDGVGRLVEALAPGDGCTIRLACTVREVRWRRGEAEITLDSGEILQARSAIITVPVTMLDGASDALGALRFVPDLKEKREAAKLLAMGHVIKLVFRFREPFWQEIEPLGDALFLHAFDQPFPTWWTAPRPELPLLTAWAGGPQALRLDGTEEETLVDLALSSLAQILGVPRRDVVQQLEAHYGHNWSSDPLTRGAYTYVTVGGVDAHKTLAQPVAGTLYFAGEATCGAGLNATMEGAVRSGWRAAAELLGQAPAR